MFIIEVPCKLEGGVKDDRVVKCMEEVEKCFVLVQERREEQERTTSEGPSYICELREM